MCARYTLSVSSLNRLLAEFACEAPPSFDYRPRYNIKPGEKQPQVTAVRLVDGKRQLCQFYWPLVPSWSKTKKLDFATVNAKAERVRTAPAYRGTYKKRRCLVLADHYIEFETAGKQKLPWLYSIDNESPFAIAGLWEAWRDPEQPKTLPYESCTLLVKEGNDLTRAVHDRMPVIVDKPHHDAWLQGEEIPLVPFLADRMSTRRTSTYVNDVRHEGPECLACVEAGVDS